MKMLQRLLIILFNAVSKLNIPKHHDKFKFNSICMPEIEKEILNLDSLKACQDSDKPTIIIKSNSQKQSSRRVL